MMGAALAYRDDFADGPGITLTPIRPPEYHHRIQGSAAVVERQLSWAGMAAEHLRALTTLPVGWDGHEGMPASMSTASFAFDVLATVMQHGVPLPAIVPLSYGALQLEWHRKGWDVELEIVAPARAHLYTRDVHSGDEEEVELHSNLEPLSAILEKIRD